MSAPRDDLTPDATTDAPTDAPTDATGVRRADAPGPLVVEVDGGVAWVRLSRPDAMNALDEALKDALVAALESLAADESVRCVVLTGSGRAFCVGQDLKEHVRSLADESAMPANDVLRPAVSAATRTSQARAKLRPAPAATPLSAATTGLFIVASAVTIRL